MGFNNPHLKGGDFITFFQEFRLMADQGLDEILKRNKRGDKK
jgi:hypothetical protein